MHYWEVIFDDSTVYAGYDFNTAAGLYEDHRRHLGKGSYVLLLQNNNVTKRTGT